MSREREQEEISIKQSDIGVLIATKTTKETSKFYYSLEEAVNRKNLEAHLQKSLGATLISIGVPAFLGSAGYLFSKIVDGDKVETLGSISAGWVSYGIIWLGSNFYDAGSLARRQWKQLKGVLSKTSESEL